MSDRRSLVIIKGEVKNNVSDYDSSLYTVDVYFENGKNTHIKKTMFKYSLILLKLILMT